MRSLRLCGLVAVSLLTFVGGGKSTRARAEEHSPTDGARQEPLKEPQATETVKPAPAPAPAKSTNAETPAGDAEPAPDDAAKPTPKATAPQNVSVQVSARLVAPLTCVADSECRKNESCEEGRCVAGTSTNAWPFYGSRPGSEGYKYVPPFLYFQKQSGPHTTRVQFPFFVQRSNASTGETTTVVPPLLFGRWTGPKGPSGRSNGGVWVGPFVWTQNEQRSLTTLFPVFWNVTDHQTGGRTNVLFPLAAFHTEKDKTWGFVGPVFGWSGKKNEWGGGVAPLVYIGRHGTRRYTLALPVFARWSDEAKGTSTTAVGPLFFHKKPDGFDLGAIPLLFAGKGKDSNYAYLPPLFWHRHSPDGNYDIVGPAYGYKGPRGWAGGLAPLLFFGKLDGTSHQVVFPLVWHFKNEAKQTEQLVVGPYYHGREGFGKDGTTKDVLFPLMYLKRSQQESLLVSPVAFWKKTPTHELLIAGPYAQASNEITHSKTKVFFPLFWKHDAPDYHVTVQFPFFWRIQDHAATSTAVFPLYYRHREPGLAFDMLFPLAMHVKTDKRALTIVGPAFYEKQPEGRTVGILPLFGYASRWDKNNLRRWFATPFAFYSADREAGTKNLWAGPFFYFERPDGYTATLPPLFAAWRRGTVSRVLAPLFYRQSDAATQSDINVLGPLYWGRNNGGETKKFGLAPILFAKWSKDGTSSTTLFPLIHYAKRKDGGLLVTPLGGYSTYAGGFRAEVGPVYVRRDKEWSSTAFWPLVYHGVNKITGERTTVGIPLYFNHTKPNGTSISAYTPLAWRYKDVERSVTVAAPIFFDVHNYSENRTTGVLPFAAVHTNYVEKSKSVIIPPLLLWARKRGVADPGYDAVWFPLVWRFGGRNPSTVVFPIVWDFKRGDDRTTVVFPVAAHWKRAENDHTLVLNTYVRKGKGPRQGQWWVDVFPLVSFGHPRKGDVEVNFIEGLVGYARQGRQRTLRLFWLIEISLAPSTAPTMTFFDQPGKEGRTTF